MTNRYVCSALTELRESLEKYFQLENEMPADERNQFSMTSRQQFIDSLVEEIQTYVNRMEAGLSDKWDLHYEQDRKKKIKEQRRSAQKKLEKLEAKIAKLKEETGEEDDE